MIMCLYLSYFVLRLSDLYQHLVLDSNVGLNIAPKTVYWNLIYFMIFMYWWIEAVERPYFSFSQSLSVVKKIYEFYVSYLPEQYVILQRVWLHFFSCCRKKNPNLKHQGGSKCNCHPYRLSSGKKLPYFLIQFPRKVFFFEIVENSNTQLPQISIFYLIN